MSQSISKINRKTAVRLVSIAFFGVIVAIPLVLQAGVRTGDAAAAIFPPWVDRDSALRRVAAADGIFIRNGGVDWIVIAKSDDPDFSARLYQSGAWLVGNAMTNTGCAGTDTTL